MSSVQACPAAGARPGGPAAAAVHCGAPPSARGHVSFSAHARAALHGQGPCWSSKRLPDRPPAFLLHILWEWRPRDSGTCRQQQPGPRAQTWGQHVPAEARGRWRASGLVPWAGGGRSSAAPSEPAVASHPRPHTELSGHTGTFDAVVPCPRTRLFCLSVQILR